MGKRGRRNLRVEISSLTILSSICAILILGFALIIMFMFFFSRQAQEDIEYYLDNTLQQFDDKIGYIKDGAISIRHNAVMNDFFHKKNYNKNEVEKQLTYCLDLFSQRNTVGQNSPFIDHVYLFNNQNHFICSRYYPTTLTAMHKLDLEYQQLQREFSATGDQYRSYPRNEKTDLCFRLFNDEMKPTGICIVSIRNTAITEIFADVEKYKNSCWLVSDNYGSTISSMGNDTQISELAFMLPNTSSPINLDGHTSLCRTLTSGFGLNAVIAIDQRNIYSVLTPMVSTFILVLVIVLAAVTAIVFAVAHRLTTPLKQMAEEIRTFGQEDLTIRMRDFPIQEFHDISTVFNEMIDRIDRLVSQIYEKELLATRSQIKFLQAQINPHFQFNILAMFSVKARLAGNDELYQGLRAFSKLMQGKIFREKEIKIPLSSEMELVNFYLYLQRSRFGDKISYEVIYGSEDVKNCLIPRLFIEPLVENAVSHGLEPKSGNGHIQIEIYERNGKLHIIVEDDGVGFEPQNGSSEAVQITKSGHTSTGLANTRRLLEILYKNQHEITIHGGVGQGTRVEIILPAERGKDDVEGNGS